MTGFQVQPDALDDFASLIGETGLQSTSIAFHYALDCWQYVGANVTLESGAGGAIFQGLPPVTTKVHDGINRGGLAITKILEQCCTNLHESAHEYRTTDSRSAKKLDAVYKPGGVVPLDPGVVDSGSVTDPSTLLTPPTADGPISDVVQEILGATDWVDLGSLGVKLLEVLGIHPQDWLTERLAGNFDEIAKVKSAVANIAAFDRACADDIATGLSTLRSHWSGSAATAASSYFDQLANSLEERAGKLDTVVDNYNDFLLFLGQVKSEIEGIMGDIISGAITIAGELAAASCLAEIPAVDVIIAIVGASTVYHVIHRISELADKWSGWVTDFDRLLAAIGLAGAAVGDWSTSVKLPASAYHNQSQTKAQHEAKAGAR